MCYSTRNCEFPHIRPRIYNGNLVGPYILPQRLSSESFLKFLETEHADMWDAIPTGMRRKVWFQLDGCPAHFGSIIRNWLNAYYEGRWIGRGGPVVWPPRSPDITPLDFYFWGQMLYDYATPVITRRESCYREYRMRVHKSIITRSRLCIQQNGSHFEQLLQ